MKSIVERKNTEPNSQAELQVRDEWGRGWKKEGRGPVQMLSEQDVHYCLHVLI